MENWYRIQAALPAPVVSGAVGFAVMLRGRKQTEGWRFAVLAMNLLASILQAGATEAETVSILSDDEPGIHTIGFGDNEGEEWLLKIAEESGGNYQFITQENQRVAT